MCAGALYWSKIGCVVWGAADEKNGHERVTGKHFPFHPKTVTRKGVMEIECAELMKSFFRKKR
jgi:tRNA(adenine34) deaminase